MIRPWPQTGDRPVVSGFVSDQNTPNTCVAVMRPVCPDCARVACWRLEKLAVNGTIAIDHGKRL